jgi:PucR family transcriptional regulator, purine catabolism regulatory protein
MSTRSPDTVVPDPGALEEISEAVESGAGLPEVVRAAARALQAGLVVIDGTSAVLASAAASPAEERSLLSHAADVRVLELRVADRVVGWMRMRHRGDAPDAASLRLVTTLVASEVERVRAPARESAAAAHDFVRALLDGALPDPADALARGRELGIELDRGASVVVCRAHPLAPAAEEWRARFLLVVDRAAHATAPGAVALPREEPAAGGAEVLVLVPDADGVAGPRVAEAARRELEAGLPGFAFAIGRSSPAVGPGDVRRAGHEALLAANVAETGREERGIVAFEDMGAYRLLLRAMSEDPAELQRFYAETVEPLVAYDDQYETDLVQTLESFLEADGNVAATAQRLFTHRHTIRYRLERVRELSGHDVGSTDGREKLGLGLKAMRVLGIAARGGPASEQGAGGGRVPRRGA